MTGTRLLAFRIFKGDPHDLADGIGVDDLLAPLRNRRKQLHKVQILMGGQVHSLRPDLTRDRNQRCAVTVGISSSRDQIRCARPKSRETDTCLAGQPSVHIRHECRALLVPHDNDPDRRLFQRPHHVQILFPRNAENILDAFVFQTFYKHFRCCQVSFWFLCYFLFFFHHTAPLPSP